MSASAQRTDRALTEGLREARERTERLVSQISDSDLERVHSTLMSPLVWDLGHIAAFEDLWLAHRYGGLPLLREGLADIYDAFETPRAQRGELGFLAPDEARVYLAEVRERALEMLEERGTCDGVICELVVRHEHQHNETMLQTMALAHLRPGTDPGAGADSGAAHDGATHNGATASPTPTGLELVTVPAGRCTIGAPADGFAYDNERPCHEIELPAFEIGVHPVTNGPFREFAAGGGYDRREWWSDAGWAWRTAERATRPLHWSPDLGAEWRGGELVALDPARPVVHVSYFEAEAFARAHGARLPTEAEWEKAASWDPSAGRARSRPWGEAETVPGVHANLDAVGGGPAVAGSLPAGRSAFGCEQLLGDVWEWTQSPFGGYPGFVAHPYREYSEVFFGTTYRVLRGGSWATRPRVATVAFRNWDLPERRQIFSGLRIARDG